MLNTLTRTSIKSLNAVLIIFLFATLLVQAQESGARISLIPQPRQLSTSTERFTVDRSTRVALADPRSVDDQFAARDFIEDLKQTSDVTIRTGGRSRRSILIGKLELPVIQNALRSAGVSVPENLHEEGYVLVAGSGGVIIGG